MAANNSTKRKSPAPKQTKTVKQSPDQITLEETVVETPKPQKPKKNTELKAQREAIEKAKAEAPKKKPIETKEVPKKDPPKKTEPSKKLKLLKRNQLKFLKSKSVQNANRYLDLNHRLRILSQREKRKSIRVKKEY